MEAICPSETSVDTQLRYIPEDGTLDLIKLVTIAIDVLADCFLPVK
jgi:hypothetical protein